MGKNRERFSHQVKTYLLGLVGKDSVVLLLSVKGSAMTQANISAYPEECLEMEFKDLDFSGLSLSGRDFDSCTFLRCQFNETDLSKSHFDRCAFSESMVSNPIMSDLRLNDISFENCKLVGLAFFKCGQPSFDLKIHGSRLIGCNFSDMSMKKSILSGNDFSDCYFQNCLAQECDFSGSRFSNVLFSKANLSKANFLDASGYSIDPNGNILKKAIFNLPGLLALLDYFDIVIK